MPRTISFAEAEEAMRAGATVRSTRWTYRMTAGRLERLNGWWEGNRWPISEEEKRAEWTMVDAK